MGNIPQNARELKKILPTGKTFCLIAGVFDLLHVGHLHLIEYAATLEELLVVAILSDRYVQGYKDPSRPIIGQGHRARMVGSLKVVDYVYVSDESPNSPEIISLLKPDSIVFGVEAAREERLNRRIKRVRESSPNTKIQLLPRYDEEEISTGHIIKKIRSG